VATAVGWLGAVAAFLVLAVAALIGRDALTVRGACVAMALTAWFAILPLSLASLLTGVIQSLGTPWGLVRHYWVLAKAVLASLATAVLLLKLPAVRDLAQIATASPTLGDDLVSLVRSLAAHAAGGLLVLLATTALGVRKPPGLTPWGARRYARAVAGQPWADAPGWAKGLAIAVGLLGLLIGVMVLGGGHGPGAHRRPPG